jgi:hypothetical protein
LDSSQKCPRTYTTPFSPRWQRRLADAYYLYHDDIDGAVEFEKAAEVRRQALFEFEKTTGMWVILGA